MFKPGDIVLTSTEFDHYVVLVLKCLSFEEECPYIALCLVDRELPEYVGTIKQLSLRSGKLQ